MSLSGVRTSHVVLARTSIDDIGRCATIVPSGAKIGVLKLEMLKKYIVSCELVIAGWLTKMEKHIRPINYPTNLWVDVMATHITNTAQTS